MSQTIFLEQRESVTKVSDNCLFVVIIVIRPILKHIDATVSLNAVNHIDTLLLWGIPFIFYPMFLLLNRVLPY